MLTREMKTNHFSLRIIAKKPQTSRLQAKIHAENIRIRKRTHCFQKVCIVYNASSWLKRPETNGHGATNVCE